MSILPRLFRRRSRPLAVKQGVDVVIEDAGAMCLVHLLTDSAEAWVRSRVDPTWYTVAGALVINRACAKDWALSMRTEGLKVGMTMGPGRV